jgi:hypothetical protein
MLPAPERSSTNHTRLLGWVEGALAKHCRMSICEQASVL